MIDTMPEFHGYQPLVAQFYQIARACAKEDPELDSWVNSGVVRVVPVDAGRVRFAVESPPTPGRRDDHLWTPDRRMLVQLIARTVECRSRRWLPDERRLLQMPDAWPDVLRGRWPGRFNCELAIGDGWVDLLIAVQSWLDELGVEIRWSQIKEKLGGLRLYFDGNAGPIGDELVTIAEVLAEHICEECGAPGKRLDRNGWLYTACHAHVRPS